MLVRNPAPASYITRKKPQEAAIARTPKSPDDTPRRTTAARSGSTSRTAAKGTRSHGATAKAPRAAAKPASPARSTRGTAAAKPARATTAAKAPRASAAGKATRAAAPAKATRTAAASRTSRSTATTAPRATSRSPRAAVTPAPRAAKPAAKATPTAKPAAPKRKAPARTKSATPPIDQVVQAAVASLEDDKAEDVVVLDVASRATFADRLIIATGLADRQIQAMAGHLERTFAEHGIRRVRMESSPDWVLLDAGDLVVHLFKPEARANYRLEKMWGPDSPPAGESVLPEEEDAAAEANFEALLESAEDDDEEDEDDLPLLDDVLDGLDEEEDEDDGTGQGGAG